jgi:hypothetical protein
VCGTVRDSLQYRYCPTRARAIGCLSQGVCVPQGLHVELMHVCVKDARVIRMLVIYTHYMRTHNTHNPKAHMAALCSTARHAPPCKC